MNLNVAFCGVSFTNPFVPASAPPTATGDMARRAFEAGWSGVLALQPSLPRQCDQYA